MEPPAPPRLFLVDGYALIYRAFFALISRPLTTSRGENTSAAWGIASFLRRLTAQYHPEYIAWVHDSGLSFRHQRYPAYKATREKLTDELQADFDRGMERIAELLAAYRIPVVTLDGYEADDVIGTLAREAAGAQVAVVIVSGDKDFQQLVRPGVWLLNPGRGGPAAVDEQWVGEANARERLGVDPSRVTDYLALVGDTSDNVPGVPGIGEKTARELVEQFGGLEAILAAAPTLTKKRPREALLEHMERARLSKELVTIREDLPITLDLPSYAVKQVDAARLRRLFIELEFHSLARDTVAPSGPATSETVEDEAGTAAAPAAGPPAVPASAPKPGGAYRVADTIEAMGEVVARVHAAGRMALDIETVLEPGSPPLVDPLRSVIVGVSIAMEPGEAWYLPFRHRRRQPAQGGLDLRDQSERGEPPPVVNLPPLGDPSMAPLRALFEDGDVGKTGQNIKYDLLVLRHAGVALRGIVFDTMLASYILDPGRRSHGLDLLALQFLDLAMLSYEDVCGKGKAAIGFDEVPVPAAAEYSGMDVDVAVRLRAVFEPQLAAQKLDGLLRDIEVPLISVLAEMEATGVAIDLAWFRSLKERFQSERGAVEQEIYRAAGTTFNINSNPQLREILFGTLGLPVLKKTVSGPSTDASVLQQLADEGHELPGLLMEYRELAKLENTYLDALPALVNPATGRLHTSFNQTVASTGRLSSSDPNLQNIPIRRELGRAIRRGFIPRPGWHFLSADYSQIELRLLAHLSDDPAFVQAFRAGGDIHRETASIIFGVPLGAVTPEMRARAKTINFATIYGQGAHSLARQLKIEFADAKQFIAQYFERFAGIRRYLDGTVALAREQGWVQTLFGRRRYIPELKDRNYNIRAFGERTATNSPIQGSAADLIKIAMIRIDRALRDRGLDAKMLLQVHDELVFEVPPSELDTVREMVRHEMEHAATLSVPLVVDVGVGDNWLDTKHT